MSNLEFDSFGTEIGPQPGPQTILLSTDCEEVFFGGALAAGKTLGLVLDFERHHQQNGKITGIAFRMSVPELDDMIAKFKEMLEPFGWEYFTGKKTFRHPDGSVLRMRHLESGKDVTKYWGHEYQWMGVDEAGDMPESTLLAVQKLRAARLRSAKGAKIRFVATGNPCGAGHKYCKERYIDPSPAFTPFKAASSGHSMIFIPGRMENNILMLQNDPKYRDRCRDLGPSWYVDALINGDWSKSPEGNMFNRDWFNHRFDLNDPPKFLFTVISWDTAFKTTKDSARSAATVWGVTENAFYLLHAFAAKLEFPALKRKAKDLYEAYRTNYVWVEDKASGPSMVQELKEGTTMPLKAIIVDGDKLRRAFVVTPLFESGKIYVPQSAAWVDGYIEELCSFPAPTGYADLVDSTSQGLTQLVRMKKRMEFFSSKKISRFNDSIYAR